MTPAESQRIWAYSLAGLATLVIAVCLVAMFVSAVTSR